MLKHILENGETRENRTGTDTIGVFGYQNRYDLNEGFPAVTTKKLFMRGVTHELIWLLSGNTNIKYLVDNDIHIWDGDAYRGYKEYMAQCEPPRTPVEMEEFLKCIKDAKPNTLPAEPSGIIVGQLGPVYGEQWRAWTRDDTSFGVDQIENAVYDLKNNPNSRRIIVTAWNPAEVPEMTLPPCHLLFQLYVSNGKLSCQLYQRSADCFLGVPFNIASYALLVHMFAQVAGLGVGEFVHTFGDLHIYKNHLEQVKEQITREPKKLPTLQLNPEVKNMADFKYEDIKLLNYESHALIKGKVSVGL